MLKTSQCQIMALPITRNTLSFFVKKWLPSTSIQPPYQETPHPFRSKIDYYVEKGSNFWETLRNSDKKWKQKIYQTGNYLLDRVDSDEWFLKEISSPSSACQIYHPSAYTTQEVKSRMKGLLEYRLTFHHKYFYYSVFCIPLSMAMGILPGPNVFLAYNLFRVYSHDKAYNGANRLRKLYDNNTLEFVSNQSLDSLLKFDQKNGDVLSDESVKRVSDAFEMPEFFTHDIKRAINQALFKNKK